MDRSATSTDRMPGWVNTALPFFAFIDDWMASRPNLALDDLTAPPDRLAIVSVDVINGFCHEGPLASPRVQGIIDPVVRLFARAWAVGVRHILLIQDTHDPHAVEFAQYPPHCVRGSPESQTVPEIASLPFFDRMTVFEKNSIQGALDTGLPGWIADHPEVDTYLAVGDCTDLCTYQLAMHLRLDANARQIGRRVIVPIETTDTYDLPVEAARAAGAVPHNAEALHRIFLYSMHLNGVEVVSRIE